MKFNLREREDGDFSKTFLNWAIILIAAFIIAFSVSRFVVMRVEVLQSSMEDTLFEGDRLWVLRTKKVSPGDIVVFDHTEKGKTEPLIKRVTAVGGETVTYENGVVRVLAADGSERVAYTNVQSWRLSSREIYIPEGQLFVMGDHVEVSRDSREFGLIPLSSVTGRVIGV